MIRDHLAAIDPDHASDHRRRVAAYLRELDEVDRYLQDSIDSIPEPNRQLVTTHDAYGYLAHRYGLTIVGTVSPSPGQEPSIADRRRLACTLEDLELRAVFVEQVAGTQAANLRDAADLSGVEIRPIWGGCLLPGCGHLRRHDAGKCRLARPRPGGTPLGDHDAPADWTSGETTRGWL